MRRYTNDPTPGPVREEKGKEYFQVNHKFVEAAHLCGPMTSF